MFKMTQNYRYALQNSNTFSFTRLREGKNILQDIRSGEEQYFTGPNQNLPDRKILVEFWPNKVKFVLFLQFFILNL